MGTDSEEVSGLTRQQRAGSGSADTGAREPCANCGHSRSLLQKNGYWTFSTVGGGQVALAEEEVVRVELGNVAFEDERGRIGKRRKRRARGDTVSETYLRVCVLDEGHDGEHLPFHAASKDEFGNVAVERNYSLRRCGHIEPVSDEPTDRYRLVFEIIDPRMVRAGWHEVVRESHDLDGLREQLAGIEKIQREGDDVRNPRIERAVITWEAVGQPKE